MDKKAVGFLLLLGVLVVAQIWTYEAFTVRRSRDCSGSDCSGANITISVGTLMALLGRNLGSDSSSSSSSSSPSASGSGSTQTPQTSATSGTSSLDAQFLSDLKGAVRSEIEKERTVMVGQELVGGGTYGKGTATGASCSQDQTQGQSFADAQGSAFLLSAPGKNPNDYVRKDSIPCWGCSLK
jgi:hypothetical protein